MTSLQIYVSQIDLVPEYGNILIKKKVLSFNKIINHLQLVHFVFSFKKSLLILKFLKISSKSFIFAFHIQVSRFISAYVVSLRSNQLIQYPVLKRLPFLYWNAVIPLWQTGVHIIFGLFVDSILFHLSIYNYLYAGASLNYCRL